jgi:hypothetical protein
VGNYRALPKAGSERIISTSSSLDDVFDITLSGKAELQSVSRLESLSWRQGVWHGLQGYGKPCGRKCEDIQMAVQKPEPIPLSSRVLRREAGARVRRMV